MVRVVKKPEERRREIISASRSLFLDQGYEKTTMQDIMTKLQIAKGTTYHYFKSKEELLDAVVAEMVDEYTGAIEKSLRECKGNAFEKMQTIVKAGRVVSPSTSHVIDNRELHARLLAVTIIKLAPFYAQIIAQGCEEGVFLVDYPLECAEVLIAGIQFVTDMGCHSWSQEDLERRMQAIPSLIESQLNAPKGTFKNLF
jgi:AcrR family transcriptional regulator